MVDTDNSPPRGFPGAEAPKKKRRGRPRKNKTEGTPVIKKKRGRPRKKVPEETEKIVLPDINIDTDNLPTEVTDVVVREYQGNQEETAGLFEEVSQGEPAVPIEEKLVKPTISPAMEEILLIEEEVDEATLAQSEEEEAVKEELDALLNEEYKFEEKPLEGSPNVTPYDPLKEEEGAESTNSVESENPTYPETLEENLPDKKLEELVEAEVQRRLLNQSFTGKKLTVLEQLAEKGVEPLASYRLSYPQTKPRQVFKIVKENIVDMPFHISEHLLEDVMIACEDTHSIYLFRMSDLQKII